MRLTLRTLLAYRDGVLSPADHEDLHRRIQQSPDAGNLLRRIQELTTSSSVPTPKLESTGLAGPNIVAEYLDDVLTSTRIAELERLFLEYNEHLCELAHCHQILAEAMHTQVDVPEALHQKALELIKPNKREEIKSQLLTQSRKLSKQLLVAEVVEPTDSVATTPNSSPVEPSNLHAAPVTPAGGSNQQAGLSLEGANLSNEVPEYLLGARKLRWRIPAAILALSILLFLLVRQLTGSLDNLRALLFAEKANPVEMSENTESKAPNPVRINFEIPTSQPPSSDKADSNIAPIESEDKSNPDLIPKPTANDATTMDASPTSDSVSSSKSDSVSPVPNTTNPIDGSSALETTSLAWNWKPADSSEIQSVVLVSSGGSMSLIDSLDQPITNANIITPPISRATFELGSLKWQSIGASVLDVAITDSKVAITTGLCRARLSASAPVQPIQLNTPAGNFEIQLLDKAAWLGVEVNYRAAAKGSIVEPGAYAPTLVVVAITDGPTTEPHLFSLKSLSDGQVVHVDTAGQGLAVFKAGKIENFTLQSPPAWYLKRSVRAIDQLGKSDFHASLSAGQEPMKERLRALATDPRPEVAALAIQTSLMLGDWQPWVTELLPNDRMRSHWDSCIDLARQTLAAQPNSVKTLSSELQNKFGADAEKILSMVVGLPEADQNNDGLIRSLKGLDSNVALPIRVLTAYELKHLTGETNDYQPHAPLRSSIQQWRLRLVGNKVPLLPVDDPINERQAK